MLKFALTILISMQVVLTPAFGEDTVLPVANDQTVNATEQTAISITLSGTDSNSNSLSYYIDQLPVNGLLTDSNGSIISSNDYLLPDEMVTYVSTSDSAINDDFTFYVNNGLSDSLIATISIEIEPVDDPPEFLSTPELTTTENVNYIYVFNAIDPDGDDISYSVTSLPNWLEFVSDESFYINGLPSYDDIGEYSILISVSDGTSTTYQSFQLTVVEDPTNVAPVFSSIPETIAIIDSEYTYTIMVSDQNQDPITITVNNLPDWLTYNETDLQIIGTPSSANVGTYSIEIIASDGELISTQDYDITVNSITVTEFTSEPLLSIEEESLYTYTFSYTSESLSPTISVDIKPDWLTYSPPVSLSGTPSSTDVGNHAVKITINDNENIVEQTFTISVLNVNGPPFFVSDPITTATENVQYVYQIVYDDNENDSISVSFGILPDWLSFNSENNILSGTPDFNDSSQTYAITATLDDGELTESQSFTITVIDQNAIPEFISTPVLIAAEDTAYSYQVEAIDPDNPDVGDPIEIISYHSSTLPGWASFDTETGEISGIPTSEYIGANEFVIHATSGGDTVTQNFTVTVENTNDFPSFTSTPIENAIEGTLYEYYVTATDEDGEAVVITESSLPEWLTFDSATNLLYGTPSSSDVGFETVQLIATSGDNNDESFQIFTINVENINDPPTILSTPVTEQYQNTFYFYSLEISDPDSSDFTFSNIESPDWLAFDTEFYAFMGTPTQNAVGVHDISIDVSDGIATINHSFTLTIININDPPEFLDLTLPIATEDTGFIQTISTLDLDGDTLTFSSSLLPDWLTLNASTGELIGTPSASDVGTTSFSISITDGEFTESETFDITVQNSNDPPEFTPSITLQTIEDLVYQGSFTVSDADGDSFTIEATIMPDWLTFSLEDLTLSGTPSNDNVGENIVQIIAYDDQSTSTLNVTITVINVDDPPVFTSSPILTVDEDSSYSYTVTVEDIDSSPIVLASSILPSWLTFDTSTGIISGTPTNSDVGIHGVSIEAVASGVTINQTFNIDVSNINDLPEFDSTPILSAVTGFNYSYYVSAFDEDGDPVMIIASVLPDWLSFDQETGELSGTPNNVSLDSDVTFQASSGSDTVEQSFSIVISDANLTLGFDSVPSEIATENIEYSYTVLASDINGNTVTYNSITLPNWLSFDDVTGVLSGVPSNDDVGNHTVVIGANTSLSSISQAFTISVQNVNNLPEFTSEPITTILENTSYSYYLSAIDIDEGDTTINYTLEDGPSWLYYDSSTGALVSETDRPNDDDVGEYSITINAQSGDDIVSQTYTLSVININDPPEIVSIPSTTVNEDTLYTYTMTIQDVDGDDISLTGNLIPSWLTFDHETGLLTGTPSNADIGANNISIYVSAGPHNFVYSFSVTVINVPDSPYFTSTPVTSATEDVLYSYTAELYDNDLIDVITFESNTPNMTIPSWLTFDTVSGILSGTPTNDDVGDHSVIIIGESGEEIVTQSFTISVENVNDIPQFISSPNISVNEDSNYSYQIIAEDDDGDAISITVTDLPNWLNFDDSSLIISGVPTNDDVGLHSVSITGTSGTDTINQSFTITVVNVNDIPVFTSTPITTLNESENYSYVVTVSDDDNDPITLEATEIPSSWLSFDPSTGILTGTPSASDAGRNKVVITATVGEDVITQEFGIIVRSLNSAPHFTSDEITTAIISNEYSYTISYLSNSTDESVTVNIISLPSFLEFDDSTDTISGSPEYYDIGEHTVTIQIENLYGSATQTFTLYVVDHEIVIDVSGSGYLITDSASLIASSENPEVIFLQNKTYLIRHIGNSDPMYLKIGDDERIIWSGTNVIFEVPNDPSLTGQYINLYKIQWENIIGISAKENNPPVFTSDPILDAFEDTLYQYEIVVVEVDDEDTLIYTILEKPDWLHWDVYTRTLSGIPADSDIGDHNVEIKIKSNLHSLTQSFVISVSSDYEYFTELPGSFDFSDGSKRKINLDFTTPTMNLSNSNLKIMDGVVSIEDLVIESAGEFHIENGSTTISDQLNIGSGSKFTISNGELTIKDFILSASDFEMAGGETEIEDLQLDSSSGFTLTNGSLTLDQLTISSGSSCQLSGGIITVQNVTGSLTNSGSMLILDAVESDTGTTLNVQSNHDANTTYVTGDYTQTSAATLSIQIENLNDYGKLAATGTITLGGTLQVDASDGLAFESGQEFNLFSAQSISGSFDTLNLPDIDDSLEWDTSNLYTTGTLKIITSALPSDRRSTLYVYPNPVIKGGGITQLYYYLDNDESLSLEIYNIFGRRIYSTSYAQGVTGGMSGHNTVELDASFIKDLSIGAYFILIHNGSSTLATGKFVIK